MTQDQAYAVDWVDANDREIARIELPFTVKNGSIENAAEFATRATRDYWIILRFTAKFAEKRGISKKTIKAATNQLTLRIGNNAAYARAFISGISRKILEPFLEILREECVGNLPAEYAKGGLTIDSEPEQKPKPKQKTVQAPCIYRAMRKINGSNHVVHDVSLPLTAVVPNPK